MVFVLALDIDFAILLKPSISRMLKENSNQEVEYWEHHQYQHTLQHFSERQPKQFLWTRQTPCGFGVIIIFPATVKIKGLLSLSCVAGDKKYNAPIIGAYYVKMPGCNKMPASYCKAVTGVQHSKCPWLVQVLIPLYRTGGNFTIRYKQSHFYWPS